MSNYTKPITITLLPGSGGHRIRVETTDKHGKPYNYGLTSVTNYCHGAYRLGETIARQARGENANPFRSVGR